MIDAQHQDPYDIPSLRGIMSSAGKINTDACHRVVIDLTESVADGAMFWSGSDPEIQTKGLLYEINRLLAIVSPGFACDIKALTELRRILGGDELCQSDCLLNNELRGYNGDSAKRR